MSVEAVTWALNDAPVRDQTALAVLFGLANHAHPDGRNSFPSREKLAWYARCSVRTTQRHLRTLETAGLISRGDQRLVQHLRADRRPVVYDLALTLRRDTHDTPSLVDDLSPEVERGDTADSHEVSPEVVRGDKAVSPEPKEPPGEPSRMQAGRAHASRGPVDNGPVDRLAGRLAAKRIDVRWDLAGDQLQRLTEHIDRWPTTDDGIRAYVAAAERAARDRGIPRSARAWVEVWLDLRPPAAHHGVTCIEHPDLSRRADGECSGCWTSRKAVVS